MVPGTLDYDDIGVTPTLEIQVHHFSGIQAGFLGTGGNGGSDNGSSGVVASGGGGCFISVLQK